jgi:hypothetical protein
LAAEVCVEQGLTVNQVSLETIRQALKKLRVRWQRAKNWITSPDPEYVRKKQRRDALIALAKRYGWVIGYQDEVWWSRVSQPDLHSWGEQDEPQTKDLLRGSDRTEKSLALSRFPTSLKWVSNKTLSHPEQKICSPRPNSFALHDSLIRVFINNDFYVVLMGARAFQDWKARPRPRNDNCDR